MTTSSVDVSEDRAIALDAADPLRGIRDEFYIPTHHGREVVYLAGNSLGCQPRGVKELIERELEDWARLGVLGHEDARDPWLAYHEQFREPLATLVGAKHREVVAMNTLTVNLHLLMVSFYRPTASRYKIVIEDSAFPSDSYAVQSQARFHGFDPADAVVRITPREGEDLLRTEDIEAVIDRDGDQIALMMMGGVNYLTGQRYDMERITAKAQSKGCVVGWDLAHGIGNVPLRLHDWGVDFATWCSYKYLNGGPGAVSGAYVHERHAGADLPRFAGWWGNDPSGRFKMIREFVPKPDVDAWQLSNPPILAMTPLKCSLEIFHRVGMEAVRTKSVAITGYMESQLRERCGDRVRIVTPADPDHRGTHLSLVVDGPREGMKDALIDAGVTVDYREPGIIRAAPAPLYVSYRDVWRFVDVLTGLLERA